ncbi:MAG: radical SAM protein [candidate division WOR-3 bacterium]|nr:radical SAM protein [candidate division WOR-3 bacterium]
MECAVITTYRCNARCKMCYSWANPTKPEEEFRPEILKKIPEGMVRLNVTGGEPTLRKDIIEILEILNTKAKKLELSTNGYFTKILVDIGKRFPDIRIRISVEGLPKLNDELRGIKNGFDHALRSILELKALGLKDIGFAIVISDKNIYDLLYLYQLCCSLGLEFSQSTMHNSFYFFKHDNKIEDLKIINEKMEDFIKQLLLSKRKNVKLRIKDWFRAYINAGLIRYMNGKERAIPCYAGTESFFVDPWGRILACNGSESPWVMGDLNTQDFDEVWHSVEASKVRELVKNCKRNCWMTGSSVPAMRKNIIQPFYWVLKNKIRLLLNRPIDVQI